MDDEAPLRALAAEMLAALRYAPETAEDGDSAVDLFRRARDEGRPFAAVVLDLTIPRGPGGVETLSRMRGIDPAVRAVVSSGYSDDPVMADPAAFGFAAVLAKPYRVGELRESLRRALAR